MTIKDELKSRFNFFHLLFLFSVVLFTSCSKSNSGGSDYYFKFTVNGKTTTFKGNPYATFNESGGLYYGGAGAFQDMNVGTKNVVSALVSGTSSIKTGTFKGLVSVPSGGDTPAVIFSWIDENGKTYSSVYQDNATNTVTITAITGSSVKGTFSGKIYDLMQPNAAEMSFSGEFYVKRMK